MLETTPEPQFIKQIAQGGEGTLHLARLGHETIVVKKHFHLNGISWKREFEVFKRAVHPHVLQLLE